MTPALVIHGAVFELDPAVQANETDEREGQICTTCVDEALQEMVLVHVLCPLSMVQGFGEAVMVAAKADEGSRTTIASAKPKASAYLFLRGVFMRASIAELRAKRNHTNTRRIQRGT